MCIPSSYSFARRKILGPHFLLRFTKLLVYSVVIAAGSFFSLPCFSDGNLTFSRTSSLEEVVSRRSMVNSFADVEQFSKQFLLHSSSEKIAELYLKALASQGRFREWSEEFFRLGALYPCLQESRDILEQFSMEVLKRGLKDSSYTVRCLSLLACGMAGDFRIVPFILDLLDDDHCYVRALAIQVAAHYPTDIVRKEISRIAFQDRSSFVRSLAYQVCAELHMKEVLPQLFAIATNRLVVASERVEAVKAIASLVDSKDFPSLLSGMTLGDIETALFVCEFSKSHDIDDIFTIFSGYLDHGCLDVKRAVLSVAIAKGRAVLSVEQDFIARIKQLIEEGFSKELVYRGAAVLFFVGDPLGEEILLRGLLSSSSHDCELASEALVGLGIYGKSLASRCLQSVCSQKAKVDLATILLVNRESVEDAGDVLLTFFQSLDKRVSSSTRALLCLGADSSSFMPSDTLYASSFQEVQDLELGVRLVRLAILSGYSKSREVLRIFSSDRRLFHGGHFLGMFIEDGAEEETERFFSKMIEDKSFTIQLEAALLHLRLYGTTQSLKHIMNMYSECSWHEKLSIIESIAVSKNRLAIPFLIEGCRESLPTLQVACAGALFCLLK